MEAAIAITDDCISETDLTAADSRYMLAKINLREGDLEGALKFMQQALEIRQNIYGFHHLAVIEIIEDLSLVLLRSKEEKGKQSVLSEMLSQDDLGDGTVSTPPRRREGSCSSMGGGGSEESHNAKSELLQPSSGEAGSSRRSSKELQHGTAPTENDESDEEDASVCALLQRRMARQLDLTGSR